MLINSSRLSEGSFQDQIGIIVGSKWDRIESSGRDVHTLHREDSMVKN